MALALKEKRKARERERERVRNVVLLKKEHKIRTTMLFATTAFSSLGCILSFLLASPIFSATKAFREER